MRLGKSFLALDTNQRAAFVVPLNIRSEIKDCLIFTAAEWFKVAKITMPENVASQLLVIYNDLIKQSRAGDESVHDMNQPLHVRYDNSKFSSDGIPRVYLNVVPMLYTFALKPGVDVVETIRAVGTQPLPRLIEWKDVKSYQAKTNRAHLERFLEANGYEPGDF